MLLSSKRLPSELRTGAKRDLFRLLTPVSSPSTLGRLSCPFSKAPYRASHLSQIVEPHGISFRKYCSRTTAGNGTLRSACSDLMKSNAHLLVLCLALSCAGIACLLAGHRWIALMKLTSMRRERARMDAYAEVRWALQSRWPCQLGLVK